MTNVPIRIVYDYDDVNPTPKKSNPNDVGYDLVYCGPRITVPFFRPGSNDHIVKLKTGVCMQAPPGTYIRIAPRSGLSLKGIVLSAGVVDPGFTGELQAVILNFSGFEYTFNKGDRIAQAIFEGVHPYPISFIPSTFLDSEDGRGEGAFGSSGR